MLYYYNIIAAVGKRKDSEMEAKFQVQLKIRKPVAEVFDGSRRSRRS